MYMERIEIICTVIGTAIAVISSSVAAVLWAFRHYAKKEYERYVENKRIEELEKKCGKLPCESGVDIKTLIMLENNEPANVFSIK